MSSPRTTNTSVCVHGLLNGMILCPSTRSFTNVLLFGTILLLTRSGACLVRLHTSRVQQSLETESSVAVISQHAADYTHCPFYFFIWEFVVLKVIGWHLYLCMHGCFAVYHLWVKLYSSVMCFGEFNSFTTKLLLAPWSVVFWLHGKLWKSCWSTTCHVMINHWPQIRHILVLEWMVLLWGTLI